MISKYCTKCGEGLRHEDVFCAKCGARTREAQVKSATTTQPPPVETPVENLSPIVEQWTELSVDAAPAKRYRLKLKNGLQVTVGFISAMSCPFCDMCNRIRIDSNGAFYPCLMDVPAGSVAAGLRPRFDASLIDAVLQTGLNHKAETHPSTGATKMVQIGG